METKRAQLNLINAYRLTHPASVDAFHSFLVSLPPGKHGHYWALIAALLSVQCRDVVALQVVKKVMRACPNGMDDVLLMTADTLLPLVNSCNFCNTKVKNIMTCTEQLQSLFQSQVPVKYKSLLKLRGVGPKIAHLMRSVAFGIDDTGIVVDTHVHKISAALNWTLKAKRPEESRLQLQRWVPKGEWTHFTLSIVGFGQTIKTKNWKAHFLTFAKNQNTLELGEDIVNRLVWSGCKIGQGADMKSNSGNSSSSGGGGGGGSGGSGGSGDTGNGSAIALGSKSSSSSPSQRGGSLSPLGQGECPHVVSFYDAFYTSSGDHTISLVLEYMDAGSLQDLINTSKNIMSSSLLLLLH